MSLSDYNSSRKPRILITNDDGIGAKGLRSLVDYVSDLGDIRVVAPDSARSGQSGAITSGVPLFLEKIEKGRLESSFMLTNTKQEAKNKLSKWLK